MAVNLASGIEASLSGYFKIVDLLIHPPIKILKSLARGAAGWHGRCDPGDERASGSMLLASMGRKSF
eukprot:SAG31_NODE_2878_length_4963_cov_9.998150_2_plen_67_part_00